MEYNSLHILENSDEGKVTTDEYSVSGMARCSLSIVMRFRLNSVLLSVFGFSKIIFKWDASWSAYKVIVSELSANFITLAKLLMFTPKTMLVSAL